jgi:hypothetical protein
MAVERKTFQNLQPGISAVDDQRVRTPINALMQWITDGFPESIDAAIAAAVPDASTTVKGIIEIATDAEAVAVTDTGRALVPSNFAGKAGQQTYATGTFTPEVSFGGGTTGITYASQSAAYTRIGRVVHIELIVALSNKGSSTGAALITGLPFAASGFSQPISMTFTAVTSGVGDTVVQGQVTASATTITLQDIATGTAAALTDVDFTNNTIIRVAGVYQTNA